MINFNHALIEKRQEWARRHGKVVGHALAEQHFDSYEEVENWVSGWFALKDEQFYWRGIHKLPEKWSKCVENNGQYFE